MKLREKYILNFYSKNYLFRSQKSGVRTKTQSVPLIIQLYGELIINMIFNVGGSAVKCLYIIRNTSFQNYLLHLCYH
jgi:hypothetical protein